MDLDDFDKSAYQKRLRLLRRFYGMNQTQFADFVGIAYKKWNHYERGYPVSRESAFILHRKLPVFSIDWLWWGDTRALPLGVSEQLRALEQQERKHLLPLHVLPKVKRRISKTDKKQRK